MRHLPQKLLCALLTLSLSAQAWSAAPQSTLEYDPEGQLTRSITPLGAPTEQSYDSLGRVSEQRLPHPTAAGTQGKIGYVYDGQGQLKSLTDPRNLITSFVTDGLGNTTSLSSPDTGSSSFVYDAAGNLTQKTDARGKIIKYTYDALNRLTKIAYVDQTVTFIYDEGTNGKGRLTTMTDAATITRWTYDAQGRVLSRVQQQSSLMLSTRYDYDAAGRLASMTYPSGRQLSYHYNAAGQLAELRLDGQALLANLAHEPFGPVSSWVWGNAQSYQRSFDANGRMNGFTLGNATRKLIWDDSSRLTTIEELTGPAGAQTVTPVAAAAYDNLDRLTGHSTASTSTAYAYDATHNRTSFTLAGTPYSYSNAATSNRLMGTAGPTPARTYADDDAGFPTADTVRASYVWFNSGALKSVTVGSTTTTYSYNGLQQRVAKSGGALARYAYDEAGHLIGEYDNSGNVVAEHVWLGDTPVGVIAKDASERLVDNGTATSTSFTIAGTWPSATTLKGYQGSHYLSHAAAESTDKVSWLPSIPVTQDYRLYARWVAAPTHSANARYTVVSGNGTGTATSTAVVSTQVAVNQQTQGGQWVYLGTFHFDKAKVAGTAMSVSLGSQADGIVVADAIKIEPVNATARTSYVFADHLDTPRALADATGKLVWRWEGEAFGTTLPNEDPDADTKKITYNLRFPGQVYDKESGLHYNFHRYYDPSTGRYVSSDPIGLDDGPNLYSYVHANPLNEVDPTGEFGVVGAGIGAGVDLAFQMLVEGKSLKCVNWGQVGLAGALGAIGGGAVGGAFKLSKGSMKAKNALRRYRRGHQVPKTHDVHHWGIEQRSWLGKRLPDSIVNHPANLNSLERGIHQRLHNEYGPLGRWWHGTPNWAKAAEAAAGAGAAAEVADDECGCEQ